MTYARLAAVLWQQEVEKHKQSVSSFKKHARPWIWRGNPGQNERKVGPAAPAPPGDL